MRRTVYTYLKLRAGQILLYLAVLGIFWGVLYLYNIRRDALIYAVILSAALFAGAGGLGLLRYCRHQKQAEEALLLLPDELRDMPNPLDRTEMIYQERLTQMFHDYEEMNTNARITHQEMIDYYSLWAHQIKTPIAAMHLLLQSYEEGGMEEGQGEFVYPMKMELFKTEQYVEMVLSYLRLSEMSSDLSLKWYETDQIVRQAVRKYAQLFILKKIRLNYRKCEGKILTDEKWLLLVLEQLLSNALKYTLEGCISIYMEPGEEDVLVIEDTGIGIQAEDLPRIFEKGFTGYNGRKDKKSTGIGLYLCKTICTKLNHGLEIESEVGKGTKVKLYLSRKKFTVE